MRIDSLLKKNDFAGSFNSYINFLTIFENISVGIDGSLTIGFFVNGFDFYLSDDEKVNDASRVADLLLNLLDEDVSIQWIYNITDKNHGFISNYKNSSIPSEEYLYIKENKISFLEQRKIKNTGIRLFVTLNNIFIPNKSVEVGFCRLLGVGRDIFRLNNYSPNNYKSRISAAEDFKDIKMKLINIENNLSSFASKLNISFKRMNNQELTTYYYEELNPLRACDIRPPEWKDMLSGATLRSQLLFSHAEIKRDYFYIDGYYYKFINMHRPPAEIDSFGITPLLNIGFLNSSGDPDFFSYDIQTAYYIPDQESTIRNIQTDRNIKASLTEAVSGGYQDYKGKSITSQLDDFLESASNTQKKVVRLSLCARIKSRDLNRLDLQSNRMLEAFKNLNGMEGISDNLEHHNLFLSFLPGHSRFNRRFHTMLSSSAAPFFPLHESFRGTSKCSIPLINRGMEGVRLDLYDNRLPSKHGIIFGKTRSGKGFMLNGFLTNFFMSGPNYHIVGVDIGGTYSKFCNIFNGDYLELNLNGTYCLNPFPPKHYVLSNCSGEEIFDPDIMVFLTGILGLMIEPEKNLSPNDKTIIKRAIQSAYDRIEGENDMPIISDVNNVLFEYSEGRDAQDKKRAMEMGKNLFQWTDISSPYNLLLNKKGGINLDNRIIIFDLQKLKGHEDLQKVVFAIIKNISFKKMYEKSSRVLFFYDECWEFMNDPKIAELVMHLYKTSGKWGGMVWSVTQEPGDLLKAGATGRSIIENSTIKIFCQLDSDVSGKDLNYCGLNEREINIVKALRVLKGHYAEYFLKFGPDSSIIRNEPSPLEYWLYCKSSEDEDLEAMMNKSHPDKSLRERLELLAKEYPNGPYGIKNK